MATATESRVMLYETIGGRYIDISGMTKNVRIKEVENYGATGSLTIVNDIGSSSSNILSSSCSLWSSGTGAVKPGMYLCVYKDSMSTSNQLGVYIVTGLSASGSTVSLTFGDAMQILRATGCEYVRNHCEGGGFDWYNVRASFDSELEKPYIPKPAGVTLYGGAYMDVKWQENLSAEMSSETGFILMDSNCTYIQATIPSTGDYLRSIEMKFLASSNLQEFHSVRIQVWIGSVEVVDELKRVRGEVIYTFPLLSGSNPYPSNYMTIRLSTTDDVRVYIGSANPQYSIYVDGESETRNGVGLVGTLEYCEGTYNVEGEEDPNNSERWIISSINDNTSFDSSILNPSAGWTHRCSTWYLSPGSALPMSTIFANILRAADFSVSTISSTRDVGIFRCNGDFYFNYLLALADMTEESGSYTGRQHGMACSRTSWGYVSLGYRRRASDSPVDTLYYAGDGSPSSGAIVMKSFAPSLSMRFRPYMSVARGTMDNGTPIYVTLRDPTVEIGSCASSVDGSITNVEDAALAAYSSIITNRSKDWEGEVVLSGIYTQFMVASGTYVGGVPVRIYDTRYGMSGYQARVKEVEYDFEEQTTTLTLNNYSEMYANSVLDSSKMAYSAGEMSVEATSKDLFVRQFVFLDRSGTTTSSGHAVQIVTDVGTTSAESRNIADISFPELELRLISAYFPAGQGSAETQYGVSAVIVNGTRIPIDTYRRPDKWANQSLIVNVLFKM